MSGFVTAAFFPNAFVADQARRIEAAGQVTGEVTGEVTEEVARLLSAITGDMSRVEMQTALGLRHEDHFRTAYLTPALSAGLLAMTIPDKPRSRKQRYRLTERGRVFLHQLETKPALATTAPRAVKSGRA